MVSERFHPDKKTPRCHFPGAYNVREMGGVLVRQLTERICAEALRFLCYYEIWRSCRQPPLAPPLGELSPKVTERALQALLNGNINVFAHTAKISINISVGKTQNIQSRRCQNA